MSSGERLSGLGGDVVGGDGLVHIFRQADRITIDSREPGTTPNTNNGRERLASVSHANRIQTCPLHLLGVQIGNHAETDCGLPDVSKRVQADRTRLLRKEVRFGLVNLSQTSGLERATKRRLEGRSA